MADGFREMELEPGADAVVASVPPVVSPEVPLAAGVPVGQDDPRFPDLDPAGSGAVGAATGSPSSAGPPLRFCRTVLRAGCYALSLRPTTSPAGFEGTLRVDRSAPDAGPDGIIVSGDLYRRPALVPPVSPSLTDPLPSPPPGSATSGAVSVAAAASRPSAAEPLAPPFRPRIPVYPRDRYDSYLKVVQVTESVAVPPGRPCTATLVLEQYDYTAPPAGSFKGSFPAAPSRTVTVTLTQAPAPPPFGGPRFTGRWLEGGVDRGTVTLSWVSPFFRRATVEIDTLTGAVAPQPVPDGSGGTEYFDTIYAKHGWQLTVVRGSTDVPVPAGANPTDCWSSGNLHSLMTAVRDPATDLDTDWRIHLVVVPAKLGCSRGVMYDQIGVPREGCASFSDDGYPSGESANFGTAADRRQREVARAFLRSATHEITHTFNQIHQEQETTADNSIMTTTPSVADVLGGPTTGAPGVFPDQIALAVNTTVRHHLVHMPDPVLRPGGWPFFSWVGTSPPQATDRQDFDPSELELEVAVPADGVALGQPVEVSWTLTNRSGDPLVVPSDVSLEGLFATMTVTDPSGRVRPFRPLAVVCDAAKLAELPPGDSVSSSHRVFWSTEGFAFPRPGPHRLSVAVTWSARGIPVGVTRDVELFVQFPTTQTDNDAAALVFTQQVGMWVALGGGAEHLADAVDRLQQLAAMSGTDATPRLLAGFSGLLPR
ncbi:hypothetical protein SAMN04488107_1970 [Geodermatophilus saharensis]|uniref:Uncharacterized protein n=1 Tax=Geodermatophilus saharensis TaxID=1137994 RepID=A0A239D2M7_9ACTN|nr:hypothetical protein [Geodermatophilus saharensis]SNS26776.1 hypothetical protein SAMN04488107_1970 [Geodermatophilus saharensis]